MIPMSCLNFCLKAPEEILYMFRSSREEMRFNFTKCMFYFMKSISSRLERNIYTSKNKEHGLNLAKGACCRVNEMEGDEAVTLLVRSARLSELSDKAARLEQSIVNELGYLAPAFN